LGGHSSEPLAAANAFGKLFSIALIEHRLVIEQIRLRWRAALKQINNSLRLRRKIRKSRQTAGSFLLAAAAAACPEADWQAQSFQTFRGLAKK